MRESQPIIQVAIDTRDFKTAELYARSAVAAGADGIMVEVHPNPNEALSDGEQSITFDQFRDLAGALRHIHDEVRTLIKDPFVTDGPAKVDGPSKH